MRRIEKAILDEWQAADQAGRALLPARVHLPHAAQRGARGVLPDRPEELLDARRGARRTCRSIVPGWEDSTLGNMFASHVHRRRREERAHRAHRHRVHDARWPSGTPQTTTDTHDRLLPDRRRHRRRLPDLRRADAAPGPAAHQRAALGLLLPDQRQHHELRLATPAPCPTRRSPGASSASTRRSSSSSPTRPSWRR